MYRKEVRRRRAVLVLLVVLCLVLISTHFSEEDTGPLHTAQNGVGAAMAPLQEATSRVLKPAEDLINWFDETFAARGENERLRDEVQDLRERLAATEDKLRQAREVGAASELAAQDPLAGFDRVDARVIARPLSSWDQTLKIDKGRSAGVELDDPVVTGDGLVGRVSQVSGGSARVTLITAGSSNVTGRAVQGEQGPLGIVSAEVGDPNSLLFSLIERDKGVRNQAEIVTAGIVDPDLPSRFPAGIPIGQVKEDEVGEQQLTDEVHVEPYADMTGLDFVSVLTGGGS